jgi:hypothetical protein
MTGYRMLLVKSDDLKWAPSKFAIDNREHAIIINLIFLAILYVPKVDRPNP